MERFKTHQVHIKKLLSESKSLIHLSFDLWTSGSNKALLGVVAQFIDASGRSHSLLLGLPELVGTHSGENQAELIIKIIQDYDITAKLGFFVMDNADNNDTALAAIFKEIRPDLLPRIKERRIRCAAHVINLVAQAFLCSNDEAAYEYAEDIDPQLLMAEKHALDTWRRIGPIGKLHNIVHYIRKTPQRRQDWLATTHYLGQLDAPGKQLMVIQNNKTRWNSTYKMIERGIKVKERLDQYCYRAIRKKKDQGPLPAQWQLEPDDWQVLTLLIDALAPFEEATLRLQGKSTTGGRGSITQVIKIYEVLLTHLEALRDRYLERIAHDEEGNPTNLPDDEEHIGTSANLSWVKLNQYYNLTDDSFAYYAAMVLNPDWKLQILEEQWRSKPVWIAEAKKLITAAYERWVDDDCKPFLPEQDLLPQQQQEPVTKPPLKKARISNIFEDYDISSRKQPTDPRAAKIKELSTYFFRYTRDLLTDETPIQWWLAYERVFPTLTSFALSILSIPAAEDECERVFSATGLLITDRRSVLKDDIIEASACERNWLSNNLIK